MCFSMFLWVNNSNTSCLFFLTLFITGIKNNIEKKSEHDAAISKYKKTFMFDWVLFFDSEIMASVEVYNASITVFKEFIMTK